METTLAAFSPVLLAFLLTRVASSSRDLSLSPADAAMRVDSYRHNSTTIDVTARGDSFLATSEVALPGWRLTRNGTTWPIQRINGALIGWHVPEGRARYRLDYEPAGLREGLMAGVVALAGLAVCVLAIRRSVPTGALR